MDDASAAAVEQRLPRRFHLLPAQHAHRSAHAPAACLCQRGAGALLGAHGVAGKARRFRVAILIGAFFLSPHSASSQAASLPSAGGAGSVA